MLEFWTYVAIVVVKGVAKPTISLLENSARLKADALSFIQAMQQKLLTCLYNRIV